MFNCPIVQLCNGRSVNWSTCTAVDWSTGVSVNQSTIQAYEYAFTWSTCRIVEHFSLCQAYWCILIVKIKKGGIPVHSLYLVLGLDEGASEDAVRSAYARIRSSLADPSRWEEGSLGRIQ